MSICAERCHRFFSFDTLIFHRTQTENRDACTEKNTYNRKETRKETRIKANACAS